MSKETLRSRRWAKVKFPNSGDELSYREFKLSRRKIPNQRPASEKKNKQDYQGNPAWITRWRHGQYGMNNISEVLLQTDHFWIFKTVQTTLNFMCAVHYWTWHHLTENIKCILKAISIKFKYFFMICWSKLWITLKDKTCWYKLETESCPATKIPHIAFSICSIWYNIKKRWCKCEQVKIYQCKIWGSKTWMFIHYHFRKIIGFFRICSTIYLW